MITEHQIDLINKYIDGKLNDFEYDDLCKLRKENTEFNDELELYIETEIALDGISFEEEDLMKEIPEKRIPILKPIFMLSSIGVAALLVLSVYLFGVDPINSKALNATFEKDRITQGSADELAASGTKFYCDGDSIEFDMGAYRLDFIKAPNEKAVSSVYVDHSKNVLYIKPWNGYGLYKFSFKHGGLEERSYYILQPRVLTYSLIVSILGLICVIVILILYFNKTKPYRL